MVKSSQKSISIVLVFSLLTVTTAGCGGSAPNPVPRYQPNDNSKSCKALFAEIQSIDDELVLKNKKKCDRDTWNVIFVVTGLLVVVPFFFMDLKGSHEIEIDALKERKIILDKIYFDKGCDDTTENKTGK